MLRFLCLCFINNNNLFSFWKGAIVKKKIEDSLAIIEEIDEEIKQDEMLAFVRKHSNVVIGGIAAVIVGIVMYSTWHERKNKKMEDVTNALLTIIQNPSSGDNLMLGKLIESAPSELKPILSIIKRGRQVMLGGGSSGEKDLEPILELANRGGVDLVWRDLAMLIYVSYSSKPSEELIKMLEPLTATERPFRFSALEFTAMFHMNAGETEKALKCLDSITNDPEAPKTMKERIKTLAQYIRSEMSE